MAVLGQVATDTRFLVSATVIAMAGAAVMAPRANGAGADVRMAFSNVRLLPCYAKANLERTVTLLAHVVTGSGGGGAGAIAAAPPFGSTLGTSAHGNATGGARATAPSTTSGCPP